MDQVDAVVIGAGVVGLAVGRALAMRGLETLVLEREHAIGTGVSSRNSEVIHAGLYYPAGSLKARLCVRGKALLYAYCESHQVAHRRCGKLVVATSPEQVPGLRALQAKAAVNGVHDLQWLTREEAQVLEPQLRCEAALLSPSTGIVDSHGLMLSLQGELERICVRSGKTILLITNDVDEAILLADRIVPLSAGPRATLGASFEVELPRPRERRALQHEPRWKSLRAELGDVLRKSAPRARGSLAGKSPRVGEVIR